MHLLFEHVRGGSVNPVDSVALVMCELCRKAGSGTKRIGSAHRQVHRRGDLEGVRRRSAEKEWWSALVRSRPASWGMAGPGQDTLGATPVFGGNRWGRLGVVSLGVAECRGGAEERRVDDVLFKPVGPSFNQVRQRPHQAGRS